MARKTASFAWPGTAATTRETSTARRLPTVSRLGATISGRVTTISRRGATVPGP